MKSSGTSHQRKRGHRAADPSLENYSEHLLSNSRTRLIKRTGRTCNGPPPKGDRHLIRRGRIPDEKTPGHEATLSPPSRTCTLEGVEDPRTNQIAAPVTVRLGIDVENYHCCPDGTASDRK
ncbi:hypothetical protein EVAR_35415_1 [Eumeta japonica]|uniref:Uncharacterized protein n=1 Tax=Eumeta variegata TaxID=151549 RepID=A0A4C1X6N9_EUMVA|nr:hypothetical protein EVAR_35415_1 [Eumeta japonica]